MQAGNLTKVVQRNAGDEGFDLVHANLLRHFPELVRDLGGNPVALMQAVGIAPEARWNAESGLSYRSWVRLLEHAANELRCSDLGLRLALRQGGRVCGQMGVAMRNSRTLGDAIAYVADHFVVHSLAAAMHLSHDPVQQILFVGHEILVDGLPHRRQVIEQALLLGHLNALEITGGQARVREVHFRHQPLSSRSAYRSYFGCTVRFEQAGDGVIFSARDLHCPVVAPNAQLYASATSLIEQRFNLVAPMHAQVRALIVRWIETEDCSNERICSELGMHPRTLHRRLKAEGRSFEGIKDDVRRDVALRYLLETDHALTFIADKLGYAEQSVLTRSCIRWFSACPSELRARGLRQAA